MEIVCVHRKVEMIVTFSAEFEKYQIESLVRHHTRNYGIEYHPYFLALDFTDEPDENIAAFEKALRSTFNID